MLRTAWFCFRGEVRQRWRAWLALGVLTGVVAGTVLLAGAGARRTASAYDRFLNHSHAYDVALVVRCGNDIVSTESAPAPADAACLRRAATRAAVEQATVVEIFNGAVLDRDGNSLQPEAQDPCYSGPGRVDIAGDRSGRFGTTLNQVQVVSGRAADPGNADEVVMTRAAADRTGTQVGDTIQIRLFDGADCLDSPSAWRPAIRLSVVGIGQSPGEIPPTSGQFYAFVHVTPAFVRTTSTQDRFSALAVRLRPDATTTELRGQLERAGISSEVGIDQAEQTTSIGHTIDAQSTALWLFAGLAAVAGAVVLGQLIARQSLIDGRGDQALRALGLRTRDLVAIGGLRGCLVGGIGAIIAIATAIAASPLMPLGVARAVEPEPGIHIDLASIAVGGVAVLVFVALVATGATWLAQRRRGALRPSRRAGRIVAPIVTALRVPPAAAVGIRMALDRGHAERRVPIWSSVAAIAIGILTLTGSLTFGASLDHLLATPRLTGWNWDLLFGSESLSGSGTAPRHAAIERALAADPDISAFTAGTLWPPFPQGRELELGPRRLGVGVLSFEGDGPIGPSVIAGRAPRTRHEILLGTDTLDRLGLSIGDVVNARGQAGTWDDPGPSTRSRFRIVGTGVLPSGIGGKLGRGAAVTLDAIATLNPDRPPDGYWVRMRDGARPRPVVARVYRRLGVKLEPGDPGFVMPTQAIRPVAVADARQLRRNPFVFAGLMAAMATAVLAYILVTALSVRRRELAVLQAIGFRGREIRRAVRWQAATYIVAASAVAVPIGVVIGRIAWRYYADRLGAVPEVAVPWKALGVAGAAGMIVSVLVATPIARRLTAHAPAAGLRAE